ALYLKYRLLKDFSFGTRSALRDCAVRSPFGPRKGEIPRPGGASRHCMNGREQKGGIDRFCAVTRRALRTCHKPLGSDSREEVYMSNERAAARNSQSGFTLLELMVVLAIIVVLAASLVPSFHNHMQAARVAATMADLRCIDSAMTNYAFTHPDSPIPPNIASYADLAAVSSSNGCWMPPEGDPDNPGPPWKFYRRLCTVVISGRITY